MEIRKYSNNNQYKIEGAEDYLKIVDNAIKDVKCGTVVLSIQNGSLVGINSTEKINY